MANTHTTFINGENPLLDSLTLLILQLLVIVVLSRIIGIFLAYINQPKVIAEVIGGILLGQSALSRIPAFKDNLFPTKSLEPLQLIANIGLILFLFLVGLELDLQVMVKSAKKAMAISLAGIIFPFAVSVGTSKILYDLVMTDADRKFPFPIFVLFNGVAMSITAFPVLARILTERKLLPTDVGQMTIAAAAVDDTLAWVLLLVVIALVNNTGNAIMALYVFLVTVAFFLILLYLVRPLFKRLINHDANRETISQTTVFLTFILVFVCSWFTQAVGVHAIFGAFVAGLILPHDHGFAIKVTEKVEDLVTIVFLPLYFAFSGLNTRLDKLDNGIIWGLVVLVIAVACLGKIVGIFFAAKFSGIKNREAISIGVLMNTKGLVELIVLNIGLQAQVINDTVFTVMVVMALVTTFMTTPLIAWIYPKKYHVSTLKQALTSPSHLSLPHSHPEEFKPLKVLLSLHAPSTTQPMMSLMQLAPTDGSSVEITALRLVQLGDRMGTLLKAQESEETLKADPVLNNFKTFAQLNHITIDSILLVSPIHDFAEHIVSTANENGINMIIISHKCMLVAEQEDQFHKRFIVNSVLSKAACSVAVFLDRGFNLGEPDFFSHQATVTSMVSLRMRYTAPEPAAVYIPFFGGADDREAMLFVLNFRRGVNVHSLILSRVQSPVDTAAQINNSTDTISDNLQLRIKALGSDDVEADADLLNIFRNEIHESIAESKNGVMSMHEVTVENICSGIIDWATTSKTGKRDLLVIGRRLYDTGVYNDANGKECSFRDYLDNVFAGSVLIVQHHAQA